MPKSKCKQTMWPSAGQSFILFCFYLDWKLSSRHFCQNVDIFCFVSIDTAAELSWRVFRQLFHFPLNSHINDVVVIFKLIPKVSCFQTHINIPWNGRFLMSLSSSAALFIFHFVCAKLIMLTSCNILRNILSIDESFFKIKKTHKICETYWRKVFYCWMSQSMLSI